MTPRWPQIAPRAWPARFSAGSSPRRTCTRAVRPRLTWSPMRPVPVPRDLDRATTSDDERRRLIVASSTMESNATRSSGSTRRLAFPIHARRDRERASRSTCTTATTVHRSLGGRSHRMVEGGRCDHTDHCRRMSVYVATGRKRANSMRLKLRRALRPRQTYEHMQRRIPWPGRATRVL